ncbi:DNA repair protein RecN [Candidatus Binatus sp.]|jgi:DNA repair protein RecN (Recombination protein N)|uniref:DNA repair protein RecN n=1 Tax=Candidatus Binatus sp. TaxID=2811406 RepID=UPI003CAF9344
MLLELNIRNFAIIEEARLEFGAGLNVLSGETGAGKTIILNALGLLLGSRASPDMIRAGEKDAVVEGLFELEGEAAMPELAARKGEGGRRELLVRRVIAEGGGRSRVTIDGELATVQILGKIGASLVQVYGQHEQHSLLRAESHREILDRYANLDDELASYRERYASAEEIQFRLQDLNQRERERANLLELARFRATELERAGLIAGEDEALSRERTVLSNASKLASAALETEQALYGDDGAATDTVSRAEARLVEAAALDPKLGDALDMIKSARANLEEAARTLGAYASKIEADPARLEEIDNRLQELTRLKRKYGGSIDTAIETLERSRAEISELEGIGESKAQVEAAMTAALDELAAHANKLSSIRRRAAADLGRKMEAELKSLGMRSPGFEPRLGALGPDEAGFVHSEATLGPFGIDTVEFHLSPNVGQPAMPLLRIASGGELSRVMLALKRLEAQRRGVATMIFDEVDAGIGGAVAQVVGRKLKQLSRFHQILCVTHLAQIAVYADRHLTVEKEERRGSTRSRVAVLEPGDRTEEIARMLGGEVSEKFRRAARELLDRARE